ncbi:hypothetical protein VTO73DRAFT_8064 [Trametes versicolor]
MSQPPISRRCSPPPPSGRHRAVSRTDDSGAPQQRGHVRAGFGVAEPCARPIGQALRATWQPGPPPLPRSRALPPLTSAACRALRIARELDRAALRTRAAPPQLGSPPAAFVEQRARCLDARRAPARCSGALRFCTRLRCYQKRTVRAPAQLAQGEWLGARAPLFRADVLFAHPPADGDRRCLRLPGVRPAPAARRPLAPDGGHEWVRRGAQWGKADRAIVRAGERGVADVLADARFNSHELGPLARPSTTGCDIRVQAAVHACTSEFRFLALPYV